MASGFPPTILTAYRIPPAERAALTARVEQLVLHTTDLSAQLAVVQAAQSETSAARDKRIQVCWKDFFFLEARNV